MNTLLENIKRIPKAYFSIADVRKVVLLSEGSLRVTLSRLVKQGRLIPLTRGWYTLDIANVDFEQLAMDIYPGGYLSFEWVLATQGILSQQPMMVTVATGARGKSIKAQGRGILYRHIQPGLFWGYHKAGKVLEADPEKAFLDLAYLSLHGYATFDAEEMNVEPLDKKKLRDYLAKIHSQKLTKLIEQSFQMKQ